MKYLTILITILFSYVCYSQNTVISVGSSWKYHDQGDVGTTNWANNNFDDTAWANGNAELGYGDGDEATVVSFGGNSSNKHITTYFRKSINLSEARGLNCQIKMDDGAVVYLNGIEIYRNGMPAGSISFSTTANSTIDENAWYTFTIPMNLTLVGQNTFAVEIHQASPSSSDISFDFEAILQPTPPPAPTSGVYINELMASNSETATDQISESSDWIEIFNNTSNALDLNGYYFTDDSTETDKFQITGSLSVPAFGRKIIWASGEPTRGVDHLGFSLSADGEFVALIQPDGTTILDSMSFSKQRTDVSFGRETDGSANLRFFSPASFNATNNSANAYLGILEPPTFSHEGGFHQNPFSLTLATTEPGTTIYYSTDGSEPKISDVGGTSYQYKNNFFSSNFLTNTYETLQYSGSLNIIDKTPDANKISRIATSLSASENAFYFPNYQLYKGTPVRAISTRSDYLPSEPVTNTYFIHSGSSPKYNLPVVSISTTESNFFDYYTGIYVLGGNNNFQQKWERPGNFEFIEGGQTKVSLPMGFRLQGSGSRIFPMKSLRLFGKSQYSENSEINYKLFPDISTTRFKRIIMRNSGNDYSQDYLVTMFRDAFIQTSVKHLDLDVQAYQPTVMFLNGEFWGLHNMRENLDQFYLEYKYGMSSDSVDIIENFEIQQGDKTGFDAMNNFFQVNNNLSSPALFATASGFVDTKSYVDYQITEIFYHNNDWITNNVSAWREQIAYNSGKPKGRDGRWRWFLFDLDFGARYYSSNLLDDAVSRQFILNRLLTNQTFKHDFINRYSDLMNSAFTSQRLINLIDSLKNNISSIIPEQIARWENINNFSTWQANVNSMKTFAQNRIGFERNHIRSEFNISGDYNLTVDVSDEVAGYVHVNSIDIIPSTPGINQNPYPWTGEYFDNIPLKIHARPNIGYKFKHWEYNGTTLTDSVLTINTPSSVSYKAIFEEDLLSENPLPLAFDVDKCGYQFKFWDEDANDGTFPVSMAFVYMDEEDPTLSANIAGFTSGDYNNNSRTRVNGLNGNGVSFINTGSERDGYPATKVGGAIMSLRTIGYDSLKLSFTAGTITSNSREYNLRLQYRIGDKLPFTDLLDDNNQIVEYTRSPISGEEQQFEVNLPNSLLGKPYVQLFWRYYYTGTRNSEASGARDEIRLDDVKIQAKLLIDQPVTVSAVYDKYGEITAGSNIDSNTSLTLEAGRSIIIKPGFSTNSQTIFTAIVTGCPE